MNNAEKGLGASEGGRARGRGRTRLVVLVMLFLALTAVQVPLLIELVVPEPWAGTPSVNEMGAAAATREWPARTPHEQAWPTITQYAIERGVGRERRRAWSSSVVNGIPQGTHQMQHDVFGWPLPALHETQRWWPSSPTWASESPWNTGVRVSWVGFVLNPLLVVVSVGVLWMVPVGVRRWVLARRRRREGCCEACGYPTGVSAVCTECGERVVRASGGVQVASAD